MRSVRGRYPAVAAWAGVGPSDSWRAGSVVGVEGRGIAAAVVVDAAVVATRACGCSCATTKRIHDGTPC